MKAEVIFALFVCLLIGFMFGATNDSTKGTNACSRKDSIHRADSATIEHLKYALKVEDDIINRLKQHK